MIERKLFQILVHCIIVSSMIILSTGCTDEDKTNDTGSTEPALHRSFWCWNLSVMPPLDENIPSTLRGQTKHACIYVADEAWKNRLITEEEISNIVMAVGEKTPANRFSGIYRMTTSVFGDAPDIDGDNRIIIFYNELKSFKGHSFDGYFTPLHEGEEFMDYTSNMADMIFLDCKNNKADSEYLLGVLAHEFQHMIQWNIDPDEESWLNETFSQAAMILNGYNSDLDAGIRYLKEKTATEPITDSSHGGYAYGGGFLFASYMIDRFGEGFIRELSACPQNGIESFNTVLPCFTEDEDFYDLILDWAAAAIVNDRSIEYGRYDYGKLRDKIETPQITGCNLGTSKEIEVKASAYCYLSYTLTSDSDVTIRITGTPENLRIKSVLKDGEDTIEVLDHNVKSGNCTYSPSAPGKMILIITRTNTEEENTDSITVTQE